MKALFYSFKEKKIVCLTFLLYTYPPYIIAFLMIHCFGDSAVMNFMISKRNISYMLYSYQVVKRTAGKCNGKSLSNCIKPERTRRPLNDSEMILIRECRRYTEIDPFGVGGICLSNVGISN